MYVDIIDLQSYTYQYKFNIILGLLPLIHDYSYTPQKCSFTSFPCHSLLPPSLFFSISLSLYMYIILYLPSLSIIINVDFKQENSSLKGLEFQNFQDENRGRRGFSDFR